MWCVVGVRQFNIMIRKKDPLLLFFLTDQKRNDIRHFMEHLFVVINPLSASVEYTPHDTVVTLDSCNSGHSEDYEKMLKFSLKFPTKWYTKLD